TDVRVGVLVVVATRQRAQLPLEALAAGVVLSRLTPAVATPVPEAIDDHLQGRFVSHHSAALAHGDVVRGIKAYGCDVAKGSDLLTLVGRSQSVAAVFHEPEIVFPAERGDRIKVEDVAQSVRDHDGLYLGTVGLLQAGDVDFVRGQGHIQKYGNEAVLEDWIDCGGESCGHRDHFIARHQATVAKLRRSQSAEGHEVCG